MLYALIIAIIAGIYLLGCVISIGIDLIDNTMQNEWRNDLAFDGTTYAILGIVFRTLRWPTRLITFVCKLMPTPEN